jgi:hypothetical protein
LSSRTSLEERKLGEESESTGNSSTVPQKPTLRPVTVHLLGELVVPKGLALMIAVQHQIPPALHFGHTGSDIRKRVEHLLLGVGQFFQPEPSLFPARATLVIRRFCLIAYGY